MKTNKLVFLLAFSTFVMSCTDTNKLTEIEIPERTAFLAPQQQFQDPASIKTKQGPFDMPELKYQFHELPELFNPEFFFKHYSITNLDYANKLNSAIHGTDFEKLNIEGIVQKASTSDQNIKILAGIYYNHLIFWQSLTIKEPKLNQNALEAITTSFGSVTNLKALCKSKAKELDGSGYLWVLQKGNNLVIELTQNNEVPLHLGQPIIAIDLWEHAYYDKFQNDTNDYIEAYFKYINWDRFNNLYK
ncbi:superoxide dismutase [Myroides pelagicus]|uniref:Superoxide dismutase n=1 Tax=Myroides pelagicus TaxID=270914 RepID=A0A7K1GP46_9FLAO|nr:superoxide dismutase [Myroides pelagicus]MEC4114550.1 superoxide dismutase [Myroides pelagicus]MTH30173.1 superoxide dismutase [Myroides pelagicus]